MSENIKVLNLYAGIGGNRKMWQNVDVTAVENNAEIAAIYQELFPQDKVVIADAHQYLLDHYKEFDFIWSSPPCQSHSDIRRMASESGSYAAKFPDMKLYEEIIFLKQFAKCPFVVENVIPYYAPLIEGIYLGRHIFWTNFQISIFVGPSEAKNITKVTANDSVFGFSLKGRKMKHRKDQVLRNLVNPNLALKIFESAFKVKQKTLLNEAVV